MNETGYLYFVVTDCQRYVKIGFASDPHARLAVLQNGHPEQLMLEGFFPATPTTEKLVKQHFEALRVRGEWFKFTEDVEEVIADLSDFQGRAFLELFIVARDSGEHVPDPDDRPALTAISVAKYVEETFGG